MLSRRCVVTDLDDTARPKFQVGAPAPRSPRVLAKEFAHLRRAGYQLVAATGASYASVLATEKQIGAFDVVAHSHCTAAVIRSGRASARFVLAPHDEIAALGHLRPLLQQVARDHHGLITDQKTCFTMYSGCPICFWNARREVERVVARCPELRFTFNPSDGGISIMPQSTTKGLLVKFLRDVLGWTIEAAAGDTGSDDVLLRAAEKVAIIAKGHPSAPVDPTLLQSLHSTTAHWHVSSRAHGHGLAEALRLARTAWSLLAS